MLIKCKLNRIPDFYTKRWHCRANAIGTNPNGYALAQPTHVGLVRANASLTDPQRQRSANASNIPSGKLSSYIDYMSCQDGMHQL
jgi:hypothetical protein